MEENEKFVAGPRWWPHTGVDGPTDRPLYDNFDFAAVKGERTEPGLKDAQQIYCIYITIDIICKNV
jgi:hypothetical protein